MALFFDLLLFLLSSVVVHSDLNCLSVMQYAIEVLKVKVVCLPCLMNACDSYLRSSLAKRNNVVLVISNV